MVLDYDDLFANWCFLVMTTLNKTEIGTFNSELHNPLIDTLIESQSMLYLGLTMNRPVEPIK